MKYVLSCDGGGVRGVLTVKFLFELEKIIGPIHEKFDMFAGTSIGGIICCFAAVHKKSMKELKQLYESEDIQEIFDKSCLDRTFGTFQLEPKYDGEGKSRIFKKYLGDCKLGNTNKHVLITSYDVIERKTKFFKSWRDKDKAIPCVNICDATSAAPAYFPSCRDNDRQLIDGGVIVNNPAMCAYVDAKKLWPDEEIRVLAVGTGYSDNPIKGTDKWGGIQWIAGGLISILMDQSHVDYQMDTILGNNYFRVDSKLRGIDDTLDNVSASHIVQLEELGQKWWDHYKEPLLKWLDH